MKKVAKLWKVGDLVFAKLKGYPPWPAKVWFLILLGYIYANFNNSFQIIEIINTRHNVYFYGTGETGSVKKEDLWHYADKKAVMASSKQLKNKKFAEAVRQIEEAMTGNDAPLDAPLDGGANAVSF